MDCSKHEWVYSCQVLLTYPPIYTRIYRLCGLVEQARGNYENLREFDDLYQKFHGKKE